MKQIIIKHPIIKKIIKYTLIAILAIIIFGLSLNFFIVLKESKNIISEDEATSFDAQCILILGAGVWGEEPSPMLKDRLEEGIALYQLGAAPKIIVSGDHGSEDYDEVNTMKNYLIDAGIPSEDIFMDHAGFSTYESMYRAKEIFGVESMIVVTQKYHMYRALFICDSLGIDAKGVNSDPREYAGQLIREIREVAARDKDVLKCITKPKASIVGDKISLDDSGDVTND